MDSVCTEMTVASSRTIDDILFKRVISKTLASDIFNLLRAWVTAGEVDEITIQAEEPSKHQPFLGSYALSAWILAARQERLRGTIHAESLQAERSA
jgi:hypothetical protein